MCSRPRPAHGRELVAEIAVQRFEPVRQSTQASRGVENEAAPIVIAIVRTSSSASTTEERSAVTMALTTVCSRDGPRRAWVELPNWFEALKTAISATTHGRWRPGRTAHWRQGEGQPFRIAGGTPGLEILLARSPAPPGRLRQVASDCSEEDKRRPSAERISAGGVGRALSVDGTRRRSDEHGQT